LNRKSLTLVSQSCNAEIGSAAAFAGEKIVASLEFAGTRKVVCIASNTADAGGGAIAGGAAHAHGSKQSSGIAR